MTPHPDNELESWALVANDSGHFIVFVLFTHGEETSFCDGHGLQADLGERIPQPQPFTGRLTANCDGERIDSWNAFLDGMASVNTNLGIPAPIGHFEGTYDPKRVTPTRCDAGQCSPSAGYDVWVGARTARFIFNLGDGDLTADEVTWAIQTVRANRDRLPVGREDDIVGSAYYNASAPSFTGDTHPDHAAVHDALFDTDQHTPGPQLGRTIPSDPNVTVTAVIDDATYCSMMCVDPPPIDPDANPDAQRTGVFQRVYGWLAFGPSATANSYWPVSFQPTVTAFSQSEDFWSRFGNGRRRTPGG